MFFLYIKAWLPEQVASGCGAKFYFDFWSGLCAYVSSDPVTLLFLWLTPPFLALVILYGLGAKKLALTAHVFIQAYYV